MIADTARRQHQPFYLIVYDIAHRAYTRVPGLQFSTRKEAEAFITEHKKRFDNGRFRVPSVHRDHGRY